MSYSQDKWIDYGNYYIYNDEQRTIGWKQARKGRVTGSIVSECIGNKNFHTPLEMANQIAGISSIPISSEQQKIMDYGTLHEDDARKWYSDMNGVTVREGGFAVPKFDSRIGMSPDGIVIINNEEVGLIEIKCPQSFYKPLIDYENKGRPSTEKYNHIWRSHYDQMQMGMAIFDKKWCDYIVFCIPDNKVFVERVYRNRDYWNEMYNKICKFIDTILKPILISIKSPYPYLPF